MSSQIAAYWILLNLVHWLSLSRSTLNVITLVISLQGFGIWDSIHTIYQNGLLSLAMDNIALDHDSCWFWVCDGFVIVDSINFLDTSSLVKLTAVATVICVPYYTYIALYFNIYHVYVSLVCIYPYYFWKN